MHPYIKNLRARCRIHEVKLIVSNKSFVEYQGFAVTGYFTHLPTPTLAFPEGMDNVMFHEIPAGGGEAQGAGRYFLKITNVGLWAAFQNKKIFCDPSGDVLPEFAGEGLARTLSGFMTPSLLWCAPELLESVSAPNVSTDAYSRGARETRRGFGAVLRKTLASTTALSAAKSRYSWWPVGTSM